MIAFAILKSIYFLYLCSTTILTNSYLQKFCILTSGPSLIIRVVRFIAIRALKIMYFLLLQYSESDMFCSAESDEDELILLTHCCSTRRFSILFYFCHRRLLWGTTPEILLWKSPILALFTAYECMNNKNRNLLSNQGQIRSCPQFPSLCHIP